MVAIAGRRIGRPRAGGALTNTLIRVSRIHHPLTALGPGRRLGIWLQGCSLHCNGCISRDTWDPIAADRMNVDDLVTECVSILAKDATLSGLTVSGGEPFEQDAALHELLAGVRAATTSRELAVDILVYSGLSWSRLQREHQQVLGLVDAVIPEPFVARHAPGARWRGSANQSLRLLTSLGRERFAPDSVAGEDGGSLPFQVVVEDGRMWTVGVPRPDDLDRLVELARRRGVKVGQLSWRS